MALFGGSVLTVLELVADSFLKLAAVGGRQELKFLGHLGYLGLSEVLFRFLQKNNLWQVNLVWDTTSNLATLLVATQFFEEKITKKQTLGVVMCLTGLYLIE